MSIPPRFKLRPPASVRSARPRLGNLPLLLGLICLLAGVTAIGAWNQSRQPKADFTPADVAKDPLAPEPGLAPASGLPNHLPAALPGDPAGSPPAAASSAVPTADPSLVSIRGSDVNIRQSPSRKAPVVARSRAGAQYRLSGERTQAEGLDWVAISLEDGRKAWVSADFIIPVSAAGPAAGTAALPSAAVDEVEAASQVVSQLLVAPGSVWPQADASLRSLTVKALLHRIFKQRPALATPDKARLLDRCMSESSKDPSLKALRVYELASACAIALEWR